MENCAAEEIDKQARTHNIRLLANKMSDMQPQLSREPNQESADLDDSEDVKCYISQSSSPISEEPKGLSVAFDRPMIAQESPPKIKIYNEENTEQKPQNTEYFRPRVRVSSEHERASLDEIDFSGDESESVTPCTPALIERRFVDTSAPIESVKHAVSRFGGTVDWKLVKNRSFEKRKNIDHELEKTQEEIPLFKQQTEAAEEAKTQVLNDLEATNQLIEELEMSLERAKGEEDEAKQNYEVADMKVKEIEQGIVEEAHVSELKCVREELETLQKEYSSLLNEKEAASMKAEEAVLASKDVEKSVEELSKELVSTKETLESTRTEQMEAEEKRVEAKETQSWEKEMKKAEEEIEEELKRQMEVEKDLKEKLNSASDLLASIESEFAAFNESSTESVAKNELEEMKLSTEKATDEVKRLKEVTTSLKNELDNEKSELAKLKQREGMASVAVASLEVEIERMKSEIYIVQMREKEAMEKAVELPKQLQMASREADEAKSAAKAAREALRKAKEDAEQAKARAITVGSRLIAAQKEIEAARVSEKQAMDSIRVLQTQSNDNEDSPERVRIPLEEYHELIKQAQEEEEQANAKMAAALAQIEAAKFEKKRTVMKLEDANRELATRKEVYKAASSKAEKASEAKLSVEQELRNWRAEHEQRRKDDVSPKKAKEGHLAALRIASSSKGSGRSDTSSPGRAGNHDHGSVESSPDVKGWKKKKKQFFPRFLTFFNKKKNSSKS
ncbi:hypothetical protein V2J09_007155 [Rumex salicifolius]